MVETLTFLADDSTVAGPVWKIVRGGVLDGGMRGKNKNKGQKK